MSDWERLEHIIFMFSFWSGILLLVKIHIINHFEIAYFSTGYLKESSMLATDIPYDRTRWEEHIWSRGVGMGQGEESTWSEKLIQRPTASEVSTLKLKIGDLVLNCDSVPSGVNETIHEVHLMQPGTQE